MEEGVLRGGGGVPEAIAQVEAEGHAVQSPGGAGPVPGVVIGPDAPAPVQHGEGVRGVEAPGLVPQGDAALRPEAVDLLVVVEMPGLFKGRGDDDAVLWLLRQADLAPEGLAAPEVLHVEGQEPLVLLRPEEEAEAPPGEARDAPGGGLRQAGLPQGQDGHGAFRDLPGVVPREGEEGGGAEAHVAVVRHGESQGDPAVGDAVVVPLLDAKGAGLHGGPAVVPEEGPGPAGLRQAAVALQQRQGGGDLMLHDGGPPFVFAIGENKALIPKGSSQGEKRIGTRAGSASWCHPNSRPGASSFPPAYGEGAVGVSAPAPPLSLGVRRRGALSGRAPLCGPGVDAYCCGIVAV